MLLSSQNPIDIWNADGFEGRKQLSNTKDI
jgi:hypothetical protein